MNDDPEFIALGTVYNALKGLEPEGQRRVIDYVTQKLGMSAIHDTSTFGDNTRVAANIGPSQAEAYEAPPPSVLESDDDTDGISPIALKWMRRSGLNVKELSHVFSLGASEIDLVAKKISGKSKNARTRSVVLLKGIAAYLSSGAARILDEQIKEACIHYDAFDPPNHAKYLRAMSTELTGTKSSGFSLTARGISAATELINELLGKTNE